MTVSHQIIRGADGVNLHAAAAGDCGPLLLFLHGFPECWLAWERQLAAFSRSYRAVALDLRGYNLSDKPSQTSAYALPRIVDDIRRVIDHLTPSGRAILVGHDWGGLAGWTLARESPELLSKLVIINAPHPVLFYRELKQKWAQRIASSYAGFFQLPGVAEATLRAFDFAALRKMVYGTSSKPRAFTPALRHAYRQAWNQPGALTAGLNYYRNPRALQSLLKQPPGWLIHVPTLVLWGERDPALLTGNLDGLDHLVPDLAVKRHPTATHWIVHEEPQWVNESLREFIER